VSFFACLKKICCWSEKERRKPRNMTRQAGVQAPAGDFGGEYRGALNRASELAYNASLAAESQKVG